MGYIMITAEKNIMAYLLSSEWEKISSDFRNQEGIHPSKIILLWEAKR